VTRSVLGLCAFLHDSSAALIDGGRVAGFVEEDKLTGLKHTGGFPEQAVNWLLSGQGLERSNVATVAYYLSGNELARAVARAITRSLQQGMQPESRALVAFYVKLLRKYRERRGLLTAAFPRARIVGIPHHLCHGLYAYANSGFPRAAILTVDSLGEGVSTTIARAEGTKYRTVWRAHDPHSLGFAFSAICEHIGFRRNDEEGTVMALAAYGDPARFRALMRSAIELRPDGFRLNEGFFSSRGAIGRDGKRLTEQFVRQTFRQRARDESIESEHRDLAAALQERLVQSFQHLASLARELTGESQLCVAGGVAMNCAALGMLRSAQIFEEVHVPPAPGDSGTALGAAAAAYIRMKSRMPEGLAHAFRQGPSFDQTSIEKMLTGKGVAYELPEDPAKFLAARLAAGQVVGVFHGPVEAGPRALGGRSILASPIASSTRDRINRDIKRREWFRPFAPMILREEVQQWFEHDWTSPYMSFALPTKSVRQEKIPAVLHKDGTARLQTVDPVHSPFVHSLLGEFKRLTGLPLLLNTSLNGQGKPIAGTPALALECFAECGLDGLLLEKCFVPA
jgi:carbamoyltransferase